MDFDLVLAAHALLVGAISIGGLVLSSRARARHNQRWAGAARTLGLSFEAGRFLFGHPRISGTIGGHFVTVEISHKSAVSSKLLQGYATAFEIASHGTLPRSLSLAEQGVLANLERVGVLGLLAMIGAGDIEIGDEEFDRRVLVRGKRTDALAALSKAARRAYVEALEDLDARLEDGALRAEMDGFADQRRIVIGVRQLVRLADLMSFEHSQLAGRLLDNLKSEPTGAVRLHLLEELRQMPPSEARAEAIRFARVHKDAWARFAAAEIDAPPALEIIRELAEDPEVDDRLRARALERVAELDRPPPIDRLLEMCEAARAETLRAIALLLGRATEIDRVEPKLIALLANDGERVRGAAGKSLGDIGTRASLAPLYEASKGVLTPAAVKQEARAAIARIRERLGASDGGHLSVVDAGAQGDLSLADAGGELSLPR